MMIDISPRVGSYPRQTAQLSKRANRHIVAIRLVPAIMKFVAVS
jgi:hypothetical protein